MVQTTNRFFDEVARVMNDAAGAAQGMRREAETMFRTQAERMMREFAVVQREEFEAVKDMARIAREENEALKARVAALEARLGVSAAPAGGIRCRARNPRVLRPFLSGDFVLGHALLGSPPSGAKGRIARTCAVRARTSRPAISA